MSRRRSYHAETLAIIERFFLALDTIVASGEIRGVQTFCRENAIDKRNLASQRADHGRGYFEAYWLLPLISKYGISERWLLLGEGAMKKDEKGAQ